MSGKLTANVCLDGAWYGPSYPDAGDPPHGAVTNPAAFTDPDDDPEGHGGQPLELEETVEDGEGVTREGTARDGKKSQSGVRGKR